MSEFVVIGFATPEEADRALTGLMRLQKEYLIDLEDAVVAVRLPDGTVRLKQTVNVAGIAAASGGLSGALWGGLIGLLFLNPLIGVAIGGAAGAGVGALSGSMVDYGIDDNLIRSIADTLKPDSSALFLLIRKVQPEKVLAELTNSGFRGTVLRSSLSPQQEASLAAALKEQASTGRAAAAAQASAAPITPAGSAA